MDFEECCEERRAAELEFVASAYDPSEAWCESSSTTTSDVAAVVHRILSLASHNSSSSASSEDHQVVVQLTLTLPQTYPLHDCLHISARLVSACSNHTTRKVMVMNALPSLTESCQAVAAANPGEESVFLVLTAADEWVQETWPSLLQSNVVVLAASATTAKAEDIAKEEERSNDNLLLGRRLIYSHHIISKIKRADMKQLANKEYKLTGYLKIGWPGLIVLEGREEDCIAFYDVIRRWNWQYLVVRGEQQEAVCNRSGVDELRKFDSFVEVDDMSVVADHCRRVGLEALFLTSMKVYANESSDDQVGNPSGNISGSDALFGALVHVDHMNAPKSYRKWLRKTSNAVGCLLLLIKQFHVKQDYSGRPTILVAVVTDDQSVKSDFFKRWRTSKVDVDAKGRPCLERQMTILSEGKLPQLMEDELLVLAEGDTLNGEATVATTKEQLMAVVDKIGGEEWQHAVQNLS